MMQSSIAATSNNSTGGSVLTEQQAQDFAQDWIEAWNSHDLDRILAHYDETVVLVSLIAAKLLNDPQGIKEDF